MERLPEIHGETPALIGTVCEEVLCQQYWYAGMLADPFNMVFLRCDGVWHSLSLDCGAVFWKSAKMPVPFECPEINASYRIVEVGVCREYVSEVSVRAIAGGSEVVIGFSSGRKMSIRNVNDATSLAV